MKPSLVMFFLLMLSFFPWVEAHGDDGEFDGAWRFRELRQRAQRYHDSRRALYRFYEGEEIPGEIQVNDPDLRAAHLGADGRLSPRLLRERDGKLFNVRVKPDTKQLRTIEMDLSLGGGIGR